MAYLASSPWRGWGTGGCGASWRTQQQLRALVHGTTFVKGARRLMARSLRPHTMTQRDAATAARALGGQPSMYGTDAWRP
eukprot:scaffold1278_cov356-Prasinococcus_capsulatus_cf.AAC.8